MNKSRLGWTPDKGAVLEVRVELVDSEPVIWRRFELRGSVVQARLSADQDQATPPGAAVSKRPSPAKARKTRGADGQTRLLQKG